MKNLYLFLLLFAASLANAQTYTWQWAKTGGASNGSSGTGFNQNYDEQVLDMAVDGNNNIYYLVPMYQNSPLLDGQPVTNYGGKNLVLFSTNCQGIIRWTRTIGSGNNSVLSQKIVLDNTGGLYISLFGGNSAIQGQNQLPLRFGDNDAMPYRDPDPFVSESAKRNAFLLKYDTSNGNLLWRRDFQGNVNIQNSNSDVSPPVIDSQGNIRIIVGLKYGSHLEGKVTVPAAYDNNTPNFQYYLATYNSAGSIVGTPSLLPLEGSTTFLGGYLNFIYDEANSRYILAGTRKYEGGSNIPLSYNTLGFNESAFVKYGPKIQRK